MESKLAVALACRRLSGPSLMPRSNLADHNKAAVNALSKDCEPTGIFLRCTCKALSHTLQ